MDFQKSQTTPTNKGDSHYENSSTGFYHHLPSREKSHIPSGKFFSKSITTAESGKETMTKFYTSRARGLYIPNLIPMYLSFGIKLKTSKPSFNID